ncbi:MAG: polysaccharide biosynthesis protein [Candidatus Ruthia sp.]|nr:polysaccharide biosynthesis protein [Candidatus Ruthturnera sp.]
MFLVDSIVLIGVLLAAFSLRLGIWYWPEDDLVWVILGAPIIAIPIFIRFGLYRAVIRYIGFKALWTVVQAVSLYALVWGVVGFMSAIEGIPRSVILINWMLSILAIGGLRMIARWVLSDVNGFNQTSKKNVIIYGAGSAGRQLLTALQQSSEYRPVAFIDDENELKRQSISGVEVFTPDETKDLISKSEASEILLAIPSASRTRRNEIIDFLEPYSVMVRSLPGVSELAQGKVNIADLKEVSIRDLLGRDMVEPNKDLLSQNIADKVVLVTGAGGSIGSELCRQIIFLKPKTLILYEMSELALYTIEKELSNIGVHSMDIYPILGSVNNKSRLTNVFERFSVDTIYHAAAYKHVPMVEFNNTEGVNNNIFGTLSCAQVAIDTGVETFVLISTDKAVRPTNTMGATKRSAELVLQALAAKQSGTKFTMVRFGNVLGSSGSVIPLFKQQIKEGGPVTVTDKDIIRYFMTIPEAVELVIQAGAMGLGGDVFVLDMGKPVKIYDLAKKMIHLTGLEVKDKSNPKGDIEIQITGLRPGEKLFEELLIGDNVSDTSHPLIMRAEEDTLAWNELKLILDELKLAIDECDHIKLRKLLMQVVPEFKPQCEISDVLYSEK